MKPKIGKLHEVSDKQPRIASLEAVTLENTPCPLGCQADDQFLFTGRDHLHGLPGEFNVVKCNVCGLMRTNPRPTSDTIAFYYPENYGPYLGTQVFANGPSSAIKRILRPLVGWVFNSRSQELPIAAPARMLEIGCASGAFMHQMSARGWQVEGIEFSEVPAQKARDLGYKVQTGALEHASRPATPVDLVVGWMVLEHLHDPVGCLWKLKEWSNPAARLVLSVPNASSLEFRIFKDKWYALHLPAHLYHFTPQSLTKILKAGGWSIEKVSHQRSLANLAMSAAYSLESKGFEKAGKWMRSFAWPRGVWFYLLFPVASLFAAFGQTGRITVWARKSADGTSNRPELMSESYEKKV